MEYVLDLFDLAKISHVSALPETGDRKAVFANGNELAVILRRKGVSGSLRGTLDICRVATDDNSVPVPYPSGVEIGRVQADLRRSGYPNLRLRDPSAARVRIGDKEIALKGKSSFKKSVGDEAGTAGGIKSPLSAKAKSYPPWVLIPGGR